MSGSQTTPRGSVRAPTGEERWETLLFILPPEAMDPGKASQTVGFGGGDSQIWVAQVRVSQAEE